MPEKWTMSPVDDTLPFPQCCEQAVPPLDIVPDVLNKMKLAEFMDVSYDDDLGIEPGNELTPMEVRPAWNYLFESR